MLRTRKTACSAAHGPKKCSQILLAMKLSQYGYDFSADLLAKYPAENRDESRLMVVNLSLIHI